MAVDLLLNMSSSSPTSSSPQTSSPISSSPKSTGPLFDRPRVIVYRFVDVIITEGRLKFDYMRMASANLHPFLREFYQEREMQDLIVDLRDQSYETRDQNPNIGAPIVFKGTQTRAAVIVSMLSNKSVQRSNRSTLSRTLCVSISTGGCDATLKRPT